MASQMVYQARLFHLKDTNNVFYAIFVPATEQHVLNSQAASSTVNLLWW